MKCDVCGKEVGKQRAWAGIFGVVVTACWACNTEGKFDRWIADAWDQLHKDQEKKSGKA